MNILHLIDNLGPGGKERQLVELLRGFSALGLDRNLVLSLTEGVFYPGLEALPNVQVKPLLRAWRWDPSVAWKLLREARAFHADVLVAWDHMSAVFALPTSLATRVRFVNAMIQDAPTRLDAKSARRARITFPFSDAIVANSRAGLRAYEAEGARSIVIHNGFDRTRVRALEAPEAVRARLGIGDCHVIGMVASFTTRKDQPLLIEVARRILAVRPNLVFLFVGEGETLNSCRDRVESQLRDRIRFLGAISNDIESLVNVFDVGVLATFTEGISNSIMEYMALSKPVVATDGGGTSELLLDGETGFLVPPHDADALAARIEQLLDDAALRERMGAAGQRRIHEAFDIDALVRAHRDLYANGIARNADAEPVGTARTDRHPTR